MVNFDQHLSVGTEENHEKPGQGNLVPTAIQTGYLKTVLIGLLEHFTFSNQLDLPSEPYKTAAMYRRNLMLLTYSMEQSPY